jgi:hypothetical protein
MPMASCATGLSVRFFSVTIPFGTLTMGQRDRQHLQLRTTRGKAQDERREYRRETAGRQQAHPHFRRHGGHVAVVDQTEALSRWNAAVTKSIGRCCCYRQCFQEGTDGEACLEPGACSAGARSDGSCSR